MLNVLSIFTRRTEKKHSENKNILYFKNIAFGPGMNIFQIQGLTNAHLFCYEPNCLIIDNISIQIINQFRC